MRHRGLRVPEKITRDDHGYRAELPGGLDWPGVAAHANANQGKRAEIRRRDGDKDPLGFAPMEYGHDFPRECTAPVFQPNDVVVRQSHHRPTERERYDQSPMPDEAPDACTTRVTGLTELLCR